MNAELLGLFQDQTGNLQCIVQFPTKCSDAEQAIHDNLPGVLCNSSWSSHFVASVQDCHSPPLLKSWPPLHFPAHPTGRAMSNSGSEILGSACRFAMTFSSIAMSSGWNPLNRSPSESDWTPNKSSSEPSIALWMPHFLMDLHILSGVTAYHDCFIHLSKSSYNGHFQFP